MVVVIHNDNVYLVGFIKRTTGASSSASVAIQSLSSAAPGSPRCSAPPQPVWVYGRAEGGHENIVCWWSIYLIPGSITARYWRVAVHYMRKADSRCAHTKNGDT
jgi:hypothetical protein